MPIDVRISDATKEGTDLPCVLTWSKPPPPGQLEELKALVTAWVRVGMYGHFGGRMHYISDFQVDDAKISWTVDMGSVEEPEHALQVLETLLTSFNDASAMVSGSATVKRLEIG